MMKKFTIIVLTFVCLNTQAEVYRWTDNNGKVHYGDQKPAAKAEDITEKVKKTNVDTSSNEHKKMESIFRKENDADRAYKEQQAKPDPELVERCKKAKEYLNIQHKRVQFYDNDGKPMKVTEAERQQRDQDARDFVTQNCSD